MVLEGLPVDVKGELTNLSHFQIEIDSSFDAANLVFEGDWEYRSKVAERNACFVEIGLVECDIDSLTLGEVLGKQHVLLPFNEKLEGMGSNQTSRGLRH